MKVLDYIKGLKVNMKPDLTGDIATSNSKKIDVLTPGGLAYAHSPEEVMVMDVTEGLISQQLTVVLTCVKRSKLLHGVVTGPIDLLVAFRKAPTIQHAIIAEEMKYDVSVVDASVVKLPGTTKVAKTEMSFDAEDKMAAAVKRRVFNRLFRKEKKHDDRNRDVD